MPRRALQGISEVAAGGCSRESLDRVYGLRRTSVDALPSEAHRRSQRPLAGAPDAVA